MVIGIVGVQCLEQRGVRAALLVSAQECIEDTTRLVTCKQGVGQLECGQGVL